jgi:hypothetical protein
MCSIPTIVGNGACWSSPKRTRGKQPSFRGHHGPS